MAWVGGHAGEGYRQVGVERMCTRSQYRAVWYGKVVQDGMDMGRMGSRCGEEG